MSHRICVIDDCGKKVIARGWCSGHYQRWSHYGDPLGVHPSKLAVRARLHDDGTRTCSACGATKSLAEFPRDSRGQGGRRLNCKACHTAKSTAWYQANKADHLPRAKARYVRDAEKIRARDAARYLRDKPKRIALATDAEHRRRARLRHGGPWEPGITHAALRKRDGDLCCYCSVSMTFDRPSREWNPVKATVEHVQPICRGGFHVWANAALACAQCNSRKQKKTLAEWVESGGPVSAALYERLRNEAA